MNEIEVVDAEGRVLAPWELEQLVADLVARAIVRDAAELRVVLARAIRRGLDRYRGRVSDP